MNRQWIIAVTPLVVIFSCSSIQGQDVRPESNTTSENSSSVNQAVVADSERSPEEQFDFIKQTYEAAAKLRSSKNDVASPGKTQQDSAEWSHICNEYADQFMKLAADNKGKPVAKKSLAWVAGQPCKKRELAIRLLLTDFPEAEESIRVIRGMQRLQNPIESMEQLKAIVGNEGLRENVRAYASLGLAQLLTSQVSHYQSLVKDAGRRNRFIEHFGEEYVDATLKIDAAAIKEQYKSIFEDLTNNFTGKKIGQIDIGETAEKRFFQIQYLSMGKVAPEIIGEGVFGENLKLSDFRGKVVVLNFWGNFCGPCKAMLHHERSLVKQLADKPFVIIGINSDMDREETQESFKVKNITWPNFWDGPLGIKGPITTRWGIRGWPSIFVLDEQGVIRYKNVRDGSLDKAITTLLAEMGHEVTLVHEKPDRETIMRDLGIKPQKATPPKKTSAKARNGMPLSSI